MLPEMKVLEPIALSRAVPLQEISTSAAFSSNDSVLIIENHSDLHQQFAVFASLPSFSSGQEPDKIFTSVYQASLKVAPSTGSATFVFADCSLPRETEYTRSIYVVTGRAHTKLEPGVTLYASDNAHLKISTRTDSKRSSCCVTMPANSEPSFVKGQEQDEKPPRLSEGEIQIGIDSSFKTGASSFPFVGLGIPNPFNRDKIIPIVVWDAIPGSEYILKPNSTWNCVRANKVYARQIIDTSLWAEKATIDFTEPHMEKTATFESNGTFSSEDSR